MQGIVELQNRLLSDASDQWNSVEAEAVITRGDESFTVPAFWRGGDRWSVRFFSAFPGAYEAEWRFTPSDENFAGRFEHDHESFRAPGADPANPLTAHGTLGISRDGHRFEYADGTPFFWLGDTWWKGLVKRFSYEDFRELTLDRKSKNFSVIQMVMGMACDEDAFDVKAENEGGYCFRPGFSEINPLYYDYADRRVDFLCGQGLTPCLLYCWGYYAALTGYEKLRRYVRNLIARYAAYPVIWGGCGEIAMPYYLSKDPGGEREAQIKMWTELLGYTRRTDPFHRLIATHPSSSGRREVTRDDAVDFDMLQCGHNVAAARVNSIALVTSGYHKLPHKPVFVAEAVYEGHMVENTDYHQRLIFWTTFLSGACGFTYGAGGIWQLNTETIPNGPSPHGGEYERTPWRVAAAFRGSSQLGLSKRYLEGFRWAEMKPCQERITPAAYGVSEDFTDWFDCRRAYDEAMRDYRGKPFFASGIGDSLLMVYLPIANYDWSTPRISGLDPEALYEASFFDPIKGEIIPAGRFKAESGEWQPPCSPLSQDFVLTVEKIHDRRWK